MGFFDTPGESLHKQMDIVMKDLITANDSVKSEVIDILDRTLPEIIDESKRWSKDGTQKMGWKLKREAKREKDYNLSKYISMFIAGVYLEATTMPQDAHAKHVLDTIEVFMTSNKNKSENNLPKRAEILNLIATCLTLPLALHYLEPNKDLADLLTNIDEESPNVVLRINAIAFGMIDAFAQKMGLNQSEHLSLATSFYISKMGMELEDAAEIVGKLTAVRPNMPLFQIIYHSGAAINDMNETGDMDGLLSLSELLAK